MTSLEQLSLEKSNGEYLARRMDYGNCHKCFRLFWNLVENVKSVHFRIFFSRHLYKVFEKNWGNWKFWHILPSSTKVLLPGLPKRPISGIYRNFTNSAHLLFLVSPPWVDKITFHHLFWPKKVISYLDSILNISTSLSQASAYFSAEIKNSTTK